MSLDINTARGAVLALAIAALAIRCTGLRNQQTRAGWIALIPFVTGAVAIQLLADGRAARLNEAVGISQFNQILVSTIAGFDFAATCWFAAMIHRTSTARPAAKLGPYVTAAFAMTAITTIAFTITAPHNRFAEQATGTWWIHASAWSIYVFTLTAITVALLISTIRRIPAGTLKTALLLVCIGTAAELIYIPLRLTRWAAEAPASVTTVTFWASTTRFALIGIGWSMITVQPLLEQRRARNRLRTLEALNRQLHDTTDTSLADHLPTSATTWAKTHELVIAINDRVLDITANDHPATAPQKALAHHLADTPEPLTEAALIHRYHQYR